MQNTMQSTTVLEWRISLDRWRIVTRHVHDWNVAFQFWKRIIVVHGEHHRFIFEWKFYAVPYTEKYDHIRRNTKSVYEDRQRPSSPPYMIVYPRNGRLTGVAMLLSYFSRNDTVERLHAVSKLHRNSTLLPILLIFRFREQNDRLPTTRRVSC